MSFNPTQFYEFGKSRFKPNLIIGGVGATINTPALLASKLGNYPSGSTFSASNIKNFTIKGNDIECYIGVDYQIKQDAFLNNSFITYFNDTGGNLKNIKSAAFRNTSNILEIKSNASGSLTGSNILNASACKKLTLPYYTYIGDGTMTNWGASNKIIQFQRCIYLGSTVGDDNVFGYTPNDAKLYVPVLLQTINSGNPDGDLVNFLSQNGTQEIIYVPNYTPPSTITDLSVNTVYATAIKLDWSIPSSTNAIEFYEVYVDGVYNKTVTTNSATVTGLTNLQTYEFTVIAVDIFYNKSLVSNTVTQQINGVDTKPFANIISYYKFENNVLDSLGTNKGTATEITYATGKVGNSAVFNGSTSLINVSDSNNLSFTDGVNDLPFSISMFAKFNDNNEVILFNKLQSANREYLVDVFSNRIDFKVFDGLGGSSNFLYNNYSFTRVIDTWYHFVFTYDGSGLASGIKTYVNAVGGGTQTEVGTYTRMQNTTSDLIFGKFSYLNILQLNGQIDDTVIWNKELSQAEVTEIYNIQNAGLELI